MADQVTTDLKYGHFGQVIYNPDDQVWLCPRILTCPPTLQPLGSSQLIFNSQYPQSGQEDTERPSVRLDRQLDSLLNSHPELNPAAHLLAQPAVVSQEIQKTLVRYDPTFGHLLAFGRIPDNATKRSMPIAAFPAADHPHVLRLIQVQPQKHGWEHNKSIWIDVPRIYGESTVWEAPHPIRQIIFADANEDSNLARTLAVRTTLGVCILRLAARKYVASWNLLDETSSRFETTQVCTLTLELCGGVAPAHVAFNRWYPKQFATVDQQGTWRVWDTSLRQIPSEHGKPIEICRGAINDQAIPEDQATASLLDDGWGRVTWAGNVQTIVTASRKCLGIYDIQAKPVRLQSPDLGIAGTPHWILDIILHPLDSSIVFILTSVSLFCLRIRCLDEFDPESYNTAGGEIVLQCRHFRDPEDIGLSLSSHVDDQELVVFIKSSMSPLATRYRFASEDSVPGFFTVTDATLVTMPEHPSTTSMPAATLAFELQTVGYGESAHHGKSSGPGKAYQDLSVKFYVATVLTSDMAIIQKLYYEFPDSVDESSLSGVAPPVWRGRLIHSRPRLPDTGFIEGYATHKDLPDINDEQPEAAIRSRSNTLKSARDNWMMLYELSHARTTGAASQTEEFSHILARIKQSLEPAEDYFNEGHKLLSELCEKQILIPDIDQAAVEFKDMVNSAPQQDVALPENDSKLSLTKVADSMALNAGLHKDMDPTSVYDSIIAHWLAPLSQTVPGRVRLIKEQLARRVAAEVCLASHVLRKPALEPAVKESQPAGIQNVGTPAPSQSYFTQSSLPTPSPTATPSVTTAASLSSHPSTLASPEFTRLQRYTTFASEKSTPAPLPKPLMNTLAHWTLGGNPDEYDWLAVQREQERKAEEEDEDLTPRERARLKRRAEKLLLKQRRESQKASAMDLANSQVPGIVSASQPVLATPSRSEAPNIPQSARAVSQGTPLLASSQAQPNTFASQVQPGRFGGKPAKKKRRVVGF